jgi:hypothetical protein
MPRLSEETFGPGDQSWLGSTHGIHECPSAAPDPALFPLTAYPSGVVPSGTPVGQVTATKQIGPYTGDSTDEVQTIAVTGSPSSGTFVVSPFGLGATAAWNIGDTVAQVQAKVDAVPALVGRVLVGGTAGAWTLTAVGASANANLGNSVVTSKSLTGGSSPDVTVTTNTQGGADASSDGREILYGFVLSDQKVPADGGWPIFRHGTVKVSRLPIPFATTGHNTSGSFIFEEA